MKEIGKEKKKGKEKEKLKSRTARRKEKSQPISVLPSGSVRLG